MTLYVGADKVADGYFGLGQVVYEGCTSFLVDSVQVTTSSPNAWQGTFELSLDGGRAYDHEFICSDGCSGSTNTMPIAVDVDSENDQADTTCLNGDLCTLVVSVDRAKCECVLRDGTLKLTPLYPMFPCLFSA